MIWTVHTTRGDWPCGSDRYLAIAVAEALRAKGRLAVVIGRRWGLP